MVQLRPCCRPVIQLRQFSTTNVCGAKICIRNLDFATTRDLLREALEANGLTPHNVDIIGTNKPGGRFWSKGYAFVDIPDSQLKRAFALDKLQILGRQIEVAKATVRPSDPLDDFMYTWPTEGDESKR